MYVSEANDLYDMLHLAMYHSLAPASHELQNVLLDLYILLLTPERGDNALFTRLA